MTTGTRTVDHEQIRRWVETRNGSPAVVAGTHDTQNSGILRIDFPDYGGEGALQHISWDEFFTIFEDRQLAFLHQDKTDRGELSRFNKFVDRDGEGE